MFSNKGGFGSTGIVNVPYKDGSVRAPHADILRIRTDLRASPIATDMEAFCEERLDHLTGPNVDELEGVVTAACQNPVAVLGDIDGSDFAAENDLRDRFCPGPGVPHSDLLVKMAADNVLLALCHQVVATRPGELGADARLRTKVPHFDRPVVAAAGHFVGIAEELG